MSKDPQQPQPGSAMKSMNLTPYQQLKCLEILQQLRTNGGQATFYLGERDTLTCLAALAAAGKVKEVETKEPFAFTYRLKDQ